MKLKSLAILSVTILLSTTSHARYLCSYYAHISDNDKYNSSGLSVITGYNKASAAAVLRQDRANFYKFGDRDYGDTGDCVMQSQQQRAKFENYLRNGTATSSAIQRIIDGNPTVKVDIYTDSINVNVD